MQVGSNWMMAAVMVAMVAVGAYAAPPAAGLRIDGIVRVKKVSPASARVIVVADEGEAQVITKDLSHFTLTLDLQTKYLLSFECDGCVTKQLVFDTHAPATGSGYDFPFQVTLEPPPTDAPFAYAGPVGLIRYDEHIADFGYDTDYKIARNEALAERLERARTELERTTPASPGVHVVKSTVSSATLPEPAAPPAVAAKDIDAPRGPFEELAPTRSERAPLVHPTGNAPRTAALPSPPPLPPPSPKPVAVPVEAEPPAPEMRSTDDGRTEEVIAEKLRVTTIVRVRRGERTTEYRRVAQYYGGVVYFKDGQACSEQSYREGIAQ